MSVPETAHVAQIPAPLAAVGRHHWVNGIVGFYDAAFGLDDIERVISADVANQLLDFLNVPERGAPVALPALLDHEVHGRFYETQLFSGSQRGVRTHQAGDHAAPLEAWRNAVVQSLLTAYPDLDGLEQLAIAKALDQLLAGLGVPDRGCYFLPIDTVRAARDS